MSSVDLLDAREDQFGDCLACPAVRAGYLYGQCVRCERHRPRSLRERDLLQSAVRILP